MNPGNHTVTFIVKGATTSRDKQGIAQKASVTTAVGGCFMQPLSVKDNVTDTEFSESTHRCISPSRGPNVAANAAVLSCKAEDTLTFRGNRYRVIGPKRFDDWNGASDHVTIFCQMQDG